MDEQIKAVVAAFNAQLDRRFGDRRTILRKDLEEEFARFMGVYLAGRFSVATPEAPTLTQNPVATDDSEKVLWEGRPQWTLDWFANQSEFDSFELRIETGFLNKDLEKIPLKRIQDISLHQSFWERLLNIGRIRVKTSDASAPIVELFAIADPNFVLQLLQDTVRKARQAAGVRLREDV